ncbi:hypothetical protein MTY_0329 [Moorella thermoacetica Y72]|uniref:Uncharacterized protein n=1 Tax=Moorella thermoacetica Y72 TaxID=1325331 RepID=A0A0S6UBY4_NEOTH|nr:hypothetical protein MTY_0329 [Moorella thermoacetica Y72]
MPCLPDYLYYTRIAIDPYPIASLYLLGGVGSTDYCGNAKFPGHNSRMSKHTASISY